MPEIFTLSLASDSNLQGYWRLENDYTDSSVNGYTLTASGGPSFVAGNFGQAVDLEETSSQYASRAAASVPNLRITTSQTWGCWVKPESANASRNCAMGVLDAAAANTYVVLKHQGVVGGDAPTFEIFGLTPALVTADSALTIGTWQLLVGRYNSSDNTLAIFINTTKKSIAVTGSISFNGNEGFSIGAVGLFTAQFADGIIDDAFIFNRALTDLEIESIFEAVGGGIPFIGY